MRERGVISMCDSPLQVSNPAINHYQGKLNKKDISVIMGEIADNYMKNFAMIIPKTAIYLLNGCRVVGATKQEFDDFKKWFEGQHYQQLQLNGMGLDMWARYNDLVIDHIAYSMQHLFINWKNNPPSTDGYGYREFEI